MEEKRMFEKFCDSNNPSIYVYVFGTGATKRYFAELPYVKGCVGSGNTKQEAIDELLENKAMRKRDAYKTCETVNIADLM